MKSLENRDPFKLGVVAIAVFVLIAGAIVLVSTLSFGKTTYTAYLENTGGLKAKEDVQVAGVFVGQVKSVELDRSKGLVKVTFNLDSDIKLGAETTADVQVATLLGTHLLMVTPKGSGSLPDNTIGVKQTTVPYNLQDVLNEGSASLQQLDAKQLATLLNTMTEELSPSTKDVTPALQGVVRLSTYVANRSGQLGDLLKAAKNVTAQLSSSSDDLVALMKSTNLVVQEVTDRRQAIHLLLTETARLAKNVNGIIGDTKADTGPALAALNGTLAQLRSQDAQLRHVLDVMAPAARYVANATGNGPYLTLYTHNNNGVLPANDCGPLALIPGVSC